MVNNSRDHKYNSNGKLHCEDGPAIIYTNGKYRIEKWCINGKLHREDGPAYISYNVIDNEIVTSRYFLNNQCISLYEHMIYNLNKLLLPYDRKIIYGAPCTIIDILTNEVVYTGTINKLEAYCLEIIDG